MANDSRKRQGKYASNNEKSTTRRRDLSRGRRMPRLAVELRPNRVARGIKRTCQPTQHVVRRLSIVTHRRESVGEVPDRRQTTYHPVVIDPRELAHEVVQINSQPRVTDPVAVKFQQFTCLQRETHMAWCHHAVRR